MLTNIKLVNRSYLGTIYSDHAHPITGTEVHVQQTSKNPELIVGDFVVLEDPGKETRRYFSSITDAAESPLYVRNPDSVVFLARRLEAEERSLTELESLPDASRETKTVMRARILKTDIEGLVAGPGFRPSSVALFRSADVSEIATYLNVPDNGFPLFLVRSNGQLYRDSHSDHAVVRLDTKAPLTGMLTVGSPGSGKTMLNGAMAWWYSTQNWACVLINNKSDDLLYLDRAADYRDPKWEGIGWSPKGVEKLQVIYPKRNGCSRTSGNLVPFSFDAEALQPEALTALIEFSQGGVIHLPQLFRYWKENAGGTIYDFIDYLESGQRHGMYSLYSMRVNGRAMTRRIHASTIDSAVSVLQSYSDYFGSKGDMPSADEIIRPGMVTVFDLSRADPLVSKLMIQHYLHQIRDYQRATITGAEGQDDNGLTPTLLEVDEAHQYFKRYSSDEMSREIERELETHIKLSRSLKVATVLATQLGSELHPAANRLATVKMILRSDRTEVRALGIPLSESEYASVEAFSPGTAQLRDGYRIKTPVYVKVPMSPAQVRGQT